MQKEKKKKGGQGTVNPKAMDEPLKDPDYQEEKQANIKNEHGRKSHKY